MGLYDFLSENNEETKKHKFNIDNSTLPNANEEAGEHKFKLFPDLKVQTLDKSNEPTNNKYNNGSIWGVPKDTSNPFKLFPDMTIDTDENKNINEDNKTAANSINYYDNLLKQNNQEVPQPSILSRIANTGLNALQFITSPLIAGYSGIMGGLKGYIDTTNNRENIANSKLSSGEIFKQDIQNIPDELKGTLSGAAKGFAAPISYPAEVIKNLFKSDKDKTSWAKQNTVGLPEVIKSLSESKDTTRQQMAKDLQNNLISQIAEKLGASKDTAQGIGTAGLDMALMSALDPITTMKGLGKSGSIINQGNKDKAILSKIGGMDKANDAATAMNETNLERAMETATEGMNNAEPIIKTAATGDILHPQFVTKVTQDLNPDISNIMEKLGQQAETDNMKQAAYLLKKAQKILGIDTDYQGITLAGKTIIPAQTLRNIGDTPLKYPAIAANVVLNPASAIDLGAKGLNNALGDTSIGKSFSKMFLNGQNADLINDAKEHPENALNDMARILSKRIIKGTKEMNENQRVADAIQYTKDTKGQSDNIADTIESPNSVIENKSVDLKQINNPEYLEQARNFNTNQINELKSQQQQLEDSIVKAQSEGKSPIEIVKAMNENRMYKEKLNELSNMKDERSLLYADQLKNQGFYKNNADVLSKIPEDYMKNPSSVLSTPLDTLTDELKGANNALNDKQALDIATQLKSSAEGILDTIDSYQPGWSKYYTGNMDFNIAEILKDNVRGLDKESELNNIVTEASKKVKLNTLPDSEAVQDMTTAKLQDVQDQLNTIKKRMIETKKYKIADKIDEDLTSIKSEMASRNATLPDEVENIENNLSKKITNTLKSNYDLSNATSKKYYINKLKEMNDRYTSLKDAGMSELKLKRMSLGQLYYESEALKNPEFDRYYRLLQGVVSNPNKNNTKIYSTVSSEEFKNALRDLHDITFKGKLANTEDLADRVSGANAKEYNSLIQNWMEKYINKDIKENPIIRTPQEEAAMELNNKTSNGFIDKFAQQKENAKQGTVYGSKGSDITNQGIKNTIEQIQKYNTDFTPDMAKNMTPKQLTAYMNSLMHGNEDASKYLPKEKETPLTKLTKKQFMDKIKNEERNLGTENIPNKSGKAVMLDTPLGKFAVDTKAPDILSKLSDMPEEVSGTTAKPTIFTDLGKAGGFNANGQSIVNANSETVIGDALHEAGHTLGNNSIGNMRKTVNIMSDEMSKLNDEQVTNLSNVINNAGLKYKVSPDDLRKGSITQYINDVTGNKTDVSHEKFAELTSLLLNPDKTVRDSVGEALPQTKEMFYNVLKKTPEKDITDLLPRTGVKDELVTKIKYTKQILDTVDTNSIKNYEDLSNKIKTLEDNYGDVDKLINGFEGSGLADKTHIPKYKTVTEETIQKVLHDNVSDLSATQKNIYDAIKQDFAHMRKEEGVLSDKDANGLATYFTHIISPENKDNPEVQKYFNMKNSGISDPFNIYSIHRKYDMTIKQMNEYMEKEHGIKNFFDTNAVRVWLKRGLSHEEIMYKKDNLSNVLNLFGHKILNTDDFKNMSIDDWSSLADELGFSPLQPDVKADVPWSWTNLPKDAIDNDWKTALEHSPDKQKIQSYISGYYDWIANKLSDGNKITSLNEKFEKTPVRTVSNDAIEKAIRTKSNLSDIVKESAVETPFTPINPKDIKIQNLYTKKGDYYLLPEAALKDYTNTVANQSKEDINGFVKLLDKYTNLMKAQAVLRPGFHVNNLSGNIFNSYLEVGKEILNPKKLYTAMKILRNKSGNFAGYSYDTIRNEAEKRGITEGFYDVDMKRASGYANGRAETLDKTPIQKLLTNINPLNNQNAVFKANQKFGSNIEQTGRMMNFITHLDNGKTFDEAADLTNKVMFDYSDLTDFERSWMKRAIPFYTFMRKNVPLQIKSMIEHPEVYAVVNEMYRDNEKGMTKEEKMTQPDYLNDSLKVGKNKYLSTNLPYQDINKVTDYKQMFSNMNPLIKLLVELPTNKNMYFNSPISNYNGDETKASAFEKLIPTLTKSTPNGKMVNKKVDYALKSILPFVQTYNKGMGMFSTNSDDTQKAKSLLTGVNVSNVNPEQAKQQAMYDYLNLLKDKVNKATKEGYINKAKTKKSTYSNPLYKYFK